MTKPQSGAKEGSSQTPSFDYLLGAYFHQDWLELEGSTTRAVIERFAQENTRELVTAARDEAATLLEKAMSEEKLASELIARRLNYLPQADGMSYTQWMTGVVEQFQLLLDE